MLAPRLAMLLKGTAWARIRTTDTSKLADPEQGIQVLLSSIATWEEAAELQTYEKFDRAIYKIVQKNDETNMSFVNRLNVAFQDLGEVTVKEMKAFILLKQSALTPDDKRKVIVMTAGKSVLKRSRWRCGRFTRRCWEVAQRQSSRKRSIQSTTWRMKLKKLTMSLKMK